MDKTSCRLTVFFENPFWVGVLECNEDGKLTVTKITFYKEPKDYEIKNFILKKYNQLNFSPAVENVVIEKQKSCYEMTNVKWKYHISLIFVFFYLNQGHRTRNFYTDLSAVGHSVMRGLVTSGQWFRRKFLCLIS